MKRKDLKVFEINGLKNFEEFVEKYERFVYSIAYKFLNNSQDAEDITQEVFLIAFKKIRTLKNPDLLTNWIYTITLNLLRENLRKKYKEKYLLTKLKNFKPIVSTIGEELRREEIKEKVNNAIRKLSPMQRKVIELRFLREFKIKEISEKINCKEGTVKVHIFRGMNSLKEILKNEM